MSETGWDKARRRARIYGGRLARSAARRGITRPCLFIHLPKCGGTSLSEALYAAVPIGRRIGVLDALSTRRAAAIAATGQDDAWICHDDMERGHETFALREQILLAHACWDTALIHGHVLFTDRVEAHVAPRYGVVTVMREPVARAVSNYRMALQAGIAPSTVDEWLASRIARQHAQVALRYLSGRAWIAEGEELDALAVAMARLERFTLVGFLDDLPHFIDRFAGIFGARLGLGRANEARGPSVVLSSVQRTRLDAMTAPDRALYDRAREIFA